MTEAIIGGGPHPSPPALVYGPSWRNKIPLIIECGKYFRCARELVGKLWIFTGCSAAAAAAAGLQTSVFARVTYTHMDTRENPTSWTTWIVGVWKDIHFEIVFHHADRK